MGRVSLHAGQVIWCHVDPVVGRAPGVRRPCVVIQSDDFGDVVHQLVLVVPCTTRDRGWSNHIPLTGDTGLTVPTYAITEQPRTVSIDRVRAVAGSVDDGCLATISRWIGAWLHPAA